MGYVELSGLGLSPMGKIAAVVKSKLPVKAKAKALPFPSAPMRRLVVKSPLVSTVKAVAPKNPLVNWRPPSGVGVTTVRIAPARPVIPALTTQKQIARNFALGREAVTKALQAKPVVVTPAAVMPSRPMIAPVVPAETVKPVYAPSGAEYKNTQVQVQAGIDPNRPESWVAPSEASGAVLSIAEPTPSASMAFVPSPEEPTDAEERSTAGQASAGSLIRFDPLQVNYAGESTGGQIAQAGFGPIMWIGLGLLALGMLRGKRR